MEKEPESPYRSSTEIPAGKEFPVLSASIGRRDQMKPHCAWIAQAGLVEFDPVHGKRPFPL
jgi:hypothetical protein